MFGRKKSKDDELRVSHREFYANCILQIEELEKEVRNTSYDGLRKSFAEFWDHDEIVEEVKKLVALARTFSIDIEQNYRTAKIDDAARRLELLQSIIDNAENRRLSISADLTAKQIMKSTGL